MYGGDVPTRRSVLAWLAAGAAGAVSGLAVRSRAHVAAASNLLERPIPSSGEMLPVVGIGTWRVFDVGASDAARAPIKEVLRRFAELGGRIIDSSPMYGAAETVVGDVATDVGVLDRLFLATKVWTSGREAGIRQMDESFRRLRATRVDLMQIHNLLDCSTHLRTLREWKTKGRVRYVGVTHYTESAYDELERVLRSEPLDFVQINYSVDERESERRILPLARDRGVAVIANRPFAEGALFGRVRGKPLPAWAAEIDCDSWAQIFLKWILGHPAVTCVIPGTGKLEHLLDNMKAATGRLPDPAMRDRIAAALR